QIGRDGADRPIDARADLFSLGCVLYRMATGELPFKGHDTLTTLWAVSTRPPVPPQQLNPDVPPALAGLILRLLAKDPAGRPPSARAVIEALDSVELGRPTKGRPALRRRRLSRSLLALLLGVLTLAGLLGGAVAYHVVRHPDDR